MKVITVVFLFSLIAFITENIASKYLLVEMGPSKDVGMFLTFLVKDLIQVVVIKYLNISIQVGCCEFFP